MIVTLAGTVMVSNDLSYDVHDCDCMKRADCP